jgi:hypothetical protein
MTADRVHTGVRLERRLVKALKALAELYDLSLGELLEKLVVSTFAGRKPFSPATLPWSPSWRRSTASTSLRCSTLTPRRGSSPWPSSTP